MVIAVTMAVTYLYDDSGDNDSDIYDETDDNGRRVNDDRGNNGGDVYTTVAMTAPRGWERAGLPLTAL